MRFVAIFIIVVAAYVAKSEALFCFTCSYTDQKRCIVANNLPSENCPEHTDAMKAKGIKEYCVKTINKNALHNKKYDRGCRLSEPYGDYCEDLKATDKNIKCYSCDYELCNGANENIVKFWMFVIALIIVMYIKHNAYYE